MKDGVTYQPTYYYEVDGKQYTYTPSYSTNVGVSKMSDPTIYYDSKNPYNAVATFQSSFNWLYIFLLLFVSIFPAVGFREIKKSKKQIEKMKYLATHGTLIKNLKYQMVRTGYSVNNRPIMAIQVEYELPSGSIIILTGNPRFDRKDFDTDGYVDLLIDPNDSTNYYIDFEITEEF